MVRGQQKAGFFCQQKLFCSKRNFMIEQNRFQFGHFHSIGLRTEIQSREGICNGFNCFIYPHTLSFSLIL